ncbi:MAG: dTDP-4-dehydrorhamnose reductase, partial [Deltaproteobacteria bacterium]
THDLANAIFGLLDLTRHPSPVTRHCLYGIYHFSNNGQCSWYEFAQEIVAQAQQFGEPVKVQRVLPIRTEDYPLPATRPAYSVFSREKYTLATGAQVPDWRSSLSTYFKLREG